MNEIIKFLGTMGVPAILIAIITLILKIKPITFLTSNSLDRKLSSKEWSFSYLLTIFIAKSAFYSTILMSLSLVSYKWNWLNNWITDTLTIVMGIGLIIAFYWLQYIVDKKKRYVPNVDWKKNLISLLYVSIYFFGWLIFFTLIIGVKAFLTYYENGDILTLGQIGLIFIVTFISSMILPIVYKPLSVYLSINKEKQFKVKIEEKKWYLLYPISKEEYMLGNKPSYIESTQLKITKKEELFESEFDVIDTL
ncbi:hypothetical protein ACN6MT_06270 [Neobacillus niacini]|uniref:hypothetical protein n=1 Tax=Neobacillus niacini TaxID=86668 RepID=UPI003B017B20